MSIPSSPEVATAETMLELGFERPFWLGLKQRLARTEGLDSILKGQFNDSNNRMDHLLERLFTITATDTVIYDFKPGSGLGVVAYDEFRSGV